MVAGNPPRNWRVNWVRGLPSGTPISSPRQVLLELVTDFGERVTDEIFDGEMGHVDVNKLMVSIVLHCDRGDKPHESEFDDTWQTGDDEDNDGGTTRDRESAPHPPPILLEAFADSACKHPLDVGRLAVDPDGCARAWLRLGNEGRSRAAARGLECRAKATCMYEGKAVHPGGGLLLSAWSPVFAVQDEGDTKQPPSAGRAGMQVRALSCCRNARWRQGEGGRRGEYQMWLFEDTRARSTGGSLWDVAMILGEIVGCLFKAATPTDGGRGGPLGEGWKLLLQGRGFEGGARVLELGAGTGAVGIVCGMAGAGEVVLTDNDDGVLELCRGNAAVNLGKGVPWRVEKLVWGADAAGLGKFDLIIASECVYAEAGFHPLCHTLLAHASEATRILLGFRNRDAKAERHVKEMLGQYFILCKCSLPGGLCELPAFCSQGGVDIFALRLRQPGDPPKPPLTAYAKYLIEQAS